MDLTIPQGTDWAVAWPITDTAGDPLDLTGWTARSQVRADPTSNDVLHEWSTAAGNVTVADSRVTLFVSNDVSSAWEWRTGWYDVELVSPEGQVSRIAQGRVRVDAEVTR